MSQYVATEPSCQTVLHQSAFKSLPLKAPSLSPSFLGDPCGTISPADFLPGPPRFRLGLIRAGSQWPVGTRQDLPAYDVKHSQRATPNTPAPEAWFACPLNPHALSAFPVRRYSRQVHLRITRLLWVHGYCSPLLCTYRSRSLIAACKCLRPIAKYPYGSISESVTRACGGGSRRRRGSHSASGPHLSGGPDVHKKDAQSASRWGVVGAPAWRWPGSLTTGERDDFATTGTQSAS